MIYSKLKKLDVEISRFGIGCMRLPLLTSAGDSGKPAKIDEPEAVRMLRHGIDNGVNYIDTAYPYHQKKSEPLVGRALQGGYRDKVYLATKMPVWQTSSYADFQNILDLQLQRLRTDHIDFYLLHALNRQSWHKVRDLGVLDFLTEAKNSGKIRWAGFSFHDQLPLFKEIIDSYHWDMTQIQLNLLDSDFQAGLEGLRYAADREIMVAIMEPLRGGALAHSVPDDIMDIWNQAATRRSPAEWAFRWLANMPEVSVILSGVSTMEQLEDNLRIFADARPGTLEPEETQLIARVQNMYRDKIKVGCTSCNYCMPCPFGVAIPEVFRLYNTMFLFAREEANKEKYRQLIDNEQDASICTECGQCETACPQGIKIIAKLKEAHIALTGE